MLKHFRVSVASSTMAVEMTRKRCVFQRVTVKASVFFLQAIIPILVFSRSQWGRILSCAWPGFARSAFPRTRLRNCVTRWRRHWVRPVCYSTPFGLLVSSQALAHYETSKAAEIFVAKSNNWFCNIVAVHVRESVSRFTSLFKAVTQKRNSEHKEQRANRSDWAAVTRYR